MFAFVAQSCKQSLPTSLHWLVTLAFVAQSVEQGTENPCVGGSIPPEGTKKSRMGFFLLVFGEQDWTKSELLFNRVLFAYVVGYKPPAPYRSPHNNEQKRENGKFIS